MTKLSSDIVRIDRSPELPYHIISEFDNFKNLMPEQIIDWQSDQNRCSFKIKGMTELNMKYEERRKNEKVVFVSDGKNPFDFMLSCQLQEVGQEHTNAQVFFEANLNPMLEMMAKKPLTNLLNMIAEKLKEVSEEQKHT